MGVSTCVTDRCELWVPLYSCAFSAWLRSGPWCAWLWHPPCHLSKLKQPQNMCGGAIWPAAKSTDHVNFPASPIAPIGAVSDWENCVENPLLHVQHGLDLNQVLCIWKLGRTCNSTVAGGGTPVLSCALCTLAPPSPVSEAQTRHYKERAATTTSLLFSRRSSKRTHCHDIMVLGVFIPHQQQLQ